MFQSLVLSLFLYFPEDKSEYIPAAISFAIFFIACIFTMKFIIKISKREAEKAKELEEQIKKNQFTQKNS
jgi:flagellar biosynthesis/type III secretory pathway M-ring protein FliF/YscJ